MDLLLIPHQTRPETSEELRRAIEDLKHSTELIRKHSKVIQEQKELLEAHDKGRKTRTNIEPLRFESRIQNQQSLELQHLKSINNDLRQNVELKIRSQQEKIDNTLKAGPTHLSDRFKSDDRRIQGLDQLNHFEKASESSTLIGQRHRTDLILAALRHAVKEEIEVRLSRRYLEALDKNESTSSDDDNSSATRLKEVQDDLENLYTEIDDVTQLLVNHDHAQQLSMRWDKVLSLQHENSVHVSQYISTDLASLSQELEELCVHKQMLQSHRVALQRFNATRVKIGTIHEGQMIRGSHLTGLDNLALQSLRRHLNLSSETESQDKWMASEKGHESLHQLLEETGSNTWLLYEMLRDNSAHGLVHTHENLNELDASIAKMKEKVDDSLKTDFESQKLFKTFGPAKNHESDK